jgi:hypothetical protein
LVDFPGQVARGLAAVPEGRPLAVRAREVVPERGLVAAEQVVAP